ncbi:MAG: DsbA family protein [Actinomycetota bacterium]|nr:DsbA family protein [Actinomycetota bacterium]
MTTTAADSPAVDVAPGMIVVFSDLMCPFAHVTIHRLFTARSRLGLDEQVRLDHHAFPIELLNRAPGTRHGSDSEVPVLGRLEPDAGWQLWQGPDYHYPSTVLLAFEAVQAAKAQSLGASERLDRALRRAFWAASRPIHIHHEILAIAATVEGLDADRLDADLRAGTSRHAVFDDYATASTDAVTMSPHLFLPDGTSLANPGITVHWQGDWAKGFPVIDSDDPTVIERMLATAAA